LREELAGLGNAELFRTCARFADVSSREEVGEEPVLQATRITLGLLAHRIGQLSEQIRDVDDRLARLVECHAPQLLEVVGVGPDTAVALLIAAGDKPERLGSEASFAALCGLSPVERSSGRRQCRRLNRGGDRQASAALHRIVFTRLRVDSRTQANRAVPASVTGSGQCWPAWSSSQQGTLHSRTGRSARIIRA
jgi:transposase